MGRIGYIMNFFRRFYLTLLPQRH